MRRFTLELSDQGCAALKHLRETMDVPSESHVLREALALYETLVELAIQQNKFFAGETAETAVQLISIPLENIRRRNTPK